MQPYQLVGSIAGERFSSGGAMRQRLINLGHDVLSTVDCAVTT